MLQFIEKILSTVCDTGNDVAAIDAFKRLRVKRGAYSEISMDESTAPFARVCCYAIHELYPLIGVETAAAPAAAAPAAAPAHSREDILTRMLIDMLFICDRPKYLKRYLAVSPNDIEERMKIYRRAHERQAAEEGYSYYEPHYVSSLLESLLEPLLEPSPLATPGPKTHTTAISTYVGCRQLVTIKTVIEHEVSMYVDVDIVCPKFVKIYMPHLEQPIYVSKVLKKYVKFAKIFDGKAKENTLSYYYKYNNNESVLEFIDEDMENEVADLLGVNILEKEIVDEEVALAKAAEMNRLTDAQVADFKAQLDEVRWNIRHAV